MLSRRLFLSPGSLWLRRLLMQLHLWLGLLLLLYAVVIGLSGSILVWAADLRAATLPHSAYDAGQVASISTLLAQAPQANGAESLSYIAPPTPIAPWWTLYYTHGNGASRIRYFDAATGRPLATHRIWVDWVADLHVYLLAGHSGFVVNCGLAMALLLVIVTGVILWWPGWSKLWRGLSCSLRRGLRRLNWEFHNAAGIWVLGLLLCWTTSAIYFLFPAAVSRMIAVISPVDTMAPPPLPVLAPTPRRIPLDELLVRYRTANYGTLSGITPPSDSLPLLTLSFDTAASGDFSHRIHLYIDARSGQLLGQWIYGQPHTVADWLLWLIYPLHFGNLWGWPVKVIWSGGGLVLALLAVTGFFIYWNRAIAPRLARLSHRTMPRQ